MFRTCFLLILICSPAAAQAARFTLEAAVAQALERNLDLAAARLAIDEARGRLLDAGRLANPELESELRPNVRGREFAAAVGWVQKFPLTNRLRLEKEISRAELAAAEAEVRIAQRKLATSVRTVGVKLLILHETQALKEKQIANSRELAASATRLAEKGEGSTIDAAQFELEAQQLELDLLGLEAQRASLVGEARSLLGVRASAAVEFTGALPSVADPGSASPDLTTRPEYQAAQARIEAARHSVALARANKWEDVEAGFGAEIERAEDAPEGIETDGIIGLRFALPLPLWNKNEGRIKTAEATAARAEKEGAAVVATARAETAAALGELRAARRILDAITSTLLPKARVLEEKIATFHQQAQPGTQLADVLRAREKRLTLEQARIDALLSLHLARIRLDAALGR